MRIFVLLLFISSVLFAGKNFSKEDARVRGYDAYYYSQLRYCNALPFYQGSMCRLKLFSKYPRIGDEY
ncbi:hypothetical protein [Campylobacter sp.]|uniref:hypothetical protein n=1 Tax=Campylobacter sp. TaxID=205 RepID=UPI0026DB891F|nr:hypothetical protein [Campylobacter sp.]MDO4674042.1 hypothetical protein [Campylobacter sp.]